MDQKLPHYQSRMLELTVIPHSNIRYDLLQHRPAFLELLVLRLSRMQLRAEFLQFKKRHQRSAFFPEFRVIITNTSTDLNLSALEELCILTRLPTHLRLSNSRKQRCNT